MPIEDYYSQLKNEVSNYFILQSKKPFLKEILKGNLSNERYTYWVRVDYVYLINFSKILALGISKGKTIEEMKVMNDYLNWILNEEMSLHVEHAKKNGISEKIEYPWFDYCTEEPVNLFTDSYSYCKKLKSNDIKIMVDTNIKLTHVN